MKLAVLLEARLARRDWVHEVKQIMYDDTRDVSVSVSAEEAQAQVNKFIDEFGHPEWSETEDTKQGHPDFVGLWQYNWQEWVTSKQDDMLQRWFITICWYEPSGRGLIKATRHRASGEWPTKPGGEEELVD